MEILNSVQCTRKRTFKEYFELYPVPEHLRFTYLSALEYKSWHEIFKFTWNDRLNSNFKLIWNDYKHKRVKRNIKPKLISFLLEYSTAATH